MTEKKEGWLVNKSETSKLINAADWSETPLGAQKDWPQSLRSALKMCLSSSSPISICWGNDLLFFYNDAWIEVLGDKHPSSLGQPAAEIFEDAWPTFNSCLRKVLSTREVTESKHQALSFSGGEEHLFNFSFSPVPAKNGSAGGVIITAVETSESQQAVEDIQRNPVQFRNMIEALPTAIYTTDAKGRLTHYNPAAVDFSGRKPELGSDRWCVTCKLYNPDGTPMPHEESPLAISLKEGRSLNGAEAIAERPDGERIWFKAYPSPLRNGNGNIIGGINMLIDVTDQKQMEEQLRQNEQELSDFFENANLGIHWVSSDGIIKRVNQAELDLLGYTREEYVGSHIADFHVDENVIEDILTKLSNREELNDYEARLQCKDGSIKHVLINSNIYKKDAKFVHTRCITRDITERKRTRQKLKEKEGQLASKVADMKRLYELSIQLQQQNDVNNTMHEVMMASAELMNADKASVQIYDKKDNVIRLVSTFGFNSDFEEQFDVIDADGITTCATALKDYDQVFVENFDNTHEYSEFAKISSSHGMKAVLSTPLFGEDDQFLGVFSMYWGNPHRPDEEKLQLLDLYTQQAARQIERQQAEQALRKNEKKYRTLFESIDEGFCIIKVLFDEEENPINYRYLETNLAYEKHTGLKDVEGKTAHEVLPNMEESWYKKHGKVALTGEPERFEKYNKELERWFSIYAFRLGNPREKKVAVIFKDITERKENEISNAYLSAIVENSDDAIISKNLKGNITSWNDSAERIFGYSADEAVGRHITLIIPDNRVDEEEEILSQLKRGDKIEHFETKRQRKDGTLLDISLTISPVRNADGKIVGASKIARDITERKEAEQKLIKNRNRLRTALEIETVGVLFWGGDDFTITEVNDAFLDMCGYSREEILGKSWRELTPEEYYSVSEEGVADLKKSGQTEPYEKQYVRKDGSRWWGLCAPRRIDDNEVVEFLLDITDRKKAEKEREQLLKKIETEKEKLSDIFKQAPSFMCILQGPDHVFERANDFYRDLVGDRELLGKPIVEAIPELKEQGLIELLDEVYDTGEPYRAKDMGIKLRRQHGKPVEKRFVDFVYQPLRDPDGSTTGVFVQGVDLSERHHAKKELEAINETLEERVEERTQTLRSYQKQLRSLASQLNKAEERERLRLASELHDKLGQMLTVAKMKVDGLQHGHLFDKGTSEVEELKQVVDDALKYNQNLMAELKPPPVLNKEDVTDVLYWTAKKMEKKGLNITIEDDGQPKPVEKEIRSMLHQSVRELFQNVINHADVNEARMVISRAQGHVKITVEDKGRGFDVEENSPAPTEEGGFGLFNIQERTDWHGGTFKIHSAPGEGTKAVLYAPLKEKAKSDIPSQNFEEVLPSSDEKRKQPELRHKIKVLLVDDHDMVRKGLRQMIEKQEDMTIVAEASNGQEAVDLTHETSPDVIVMDVNMPVLDGIEATQKIKGDMPNVRIIGLSLHDSPEVIQDMQSAGASDYLTKDEAFETLCVTIRGGATTKGS